MAYNNLKNDVQDVDINYLAKDFQTYKNALINHTKTYFPNNFNDFSEGNPGMMFIEMAAYVGEVLTFYLDTQIQENFVDMAQDRASLYNHAYTRGYTPKNTSAATVNLDISQLVPSKQTTDSEGNTVFVPDYDFALNIKANSTFSSVEGNQNFYITEDANFQYSSSFNNISSSLFSLNTSNNPEYYLLTTQVPAVSGITKTENVTVGAPQRFKTITLFDDNIISIESIIDSDGNEYHEVPYLAQDTIFEEVSNNAANDPELHQYSNETPYLLKLKKVARRFVTRVKPDRRLDIQFGAGTSNKHDEEIIPDPNNIGLGIKDGRSKLDRAYDPSNFLFSDSYGKVPSNTTLTITYLVGGGTSANVSSNTINHVGNLQYDYNVNVSLAMRNFVVSSISVTNKEPARGGGPGDSIEDIRLNTMASFSSQNRTVTKEDYIIRALSLPPQFGSVSKAYITQDDQISPDYSYGTSNRIPNPLALNLYTLGYGISGQLVTLNTATKTNLATYLEQHRVLTDAVNIKDAFIINFSIDFSITVFKNFNNQSVLLECIEKLKSYFNRNKWQINQPILISDVMNTIGAIRGVQTVEDVIFENKSGIALGYSQYRYSLKDATKNNVIYPSLDPSIFEIRFPNADIKGQVTTYSR